MSLETAIWDVLGPIRAWVSADKETGLPVFWLDGRIMSERAIKTEARRVWRERNSTTW